MWGSEGRERQGRGRRMGEGKNKGELGSQRKRNEEAVGRGKRDGGVGDCERG